MRTSDEVEVGAGVLDGSRRSPFLVDLQAVEGAEDGDAVAAHGDHGVVDAARLGEWENFWFPMVRASLTHRFPEIGNQLFLNLTQTT
jgi:hypothetical protein